MVLSMTFLAQCNQVGSFIQTAVTLADNVVRYFCRSSAYLTQWMIGQELISDHFPLPVVPTLCCSWSAGIMGALILSLMKGAP